MSSNQPSVAVRALCFAAIAAGLGAVSCLLATRAVGPPPELYERDFHVTRPDDAPVDVTPAKPLVLPYPFADFDLTADVELPTGGTLDLVLRQVEPKRRAGGDMALFHGRFVALRLSATGRGGPAFRTREQALFDDGFESGQDLAPGRPATVVVQARGRALRANVAGVWHGPFEATDAHGDLTFVARGGTALVRTLRVDWRPRPLRLLPIGWCAILGAAVGLCVALRGRRERLALLAVPLVAWLGGGLLLCHELPETEPDVLAIVLVALAGAPLSVALAGRLRVATLALGVLAALGAAEVAARIERARLAPLEDFRLDACFGAMSGTAPADALARRMRGRVAVHTIDFDGVPIVLLGGDPLFEGGVDVETWVGPMAAANAGNRLGQRLDAAIAPTVYGHAGQQVLMFTRFYADAFAPRAVVLAIPPWEGEASERAAVGAWFRAGGAPPSLGPPAADAPASALLELWSAATSAPVPTTDPAGLRRTLADLAELGRRLGFSVLLVDDPGLSPDLRAVVDGAVEAHGFARQTLALLGDPTGSIEPLGAAIAALLSR